MTSEDINNSESQQNYAYSDFTGDQLVFLLGEILKVELVDMLFVGNVINRLATWEGEPGNEEAWMIVADQLLCEHIYTFETDGPKEFVSKEEFMRMAIVDRARHFDFIGNYLETPALARDAADDSLSEGDLTATADLARMQLEPTSSPSNAHFANTDYLDGKAIFGVNCTFCGGREKNLDFFTASKWIDQHNTSKCG